MRWLEWTLLTCQPTRYNIIHVPCYIVTITPFCNMCNLVVSKWKYLLFMGVEMLQQASSTRLGSGPWEIICFWHFYFKYRLIKLRLRVGTEKQTTLGYFCRMGIAISLWWLNVKKVTFWLSPLGATLKVNVSMQLYGWYAYYELYYISLEGGLSAALGYICGEMSGHWSRGWGI